MVARMNRMALATLAGCMILVPAARAQFNAEEANAYDAAAHTDVEEESIGGPAWNKWEIGPEVFMYQYNEPGLMELNGLLYGIGGRFTRYMPRVRQVKSGRGEDAVVTEKESMMMLRIDGRYAMGTHDYDGALQNGTPYTMDGIDATSYEFRAMVGYSAQAQMDRMTAFYAGFGMRYKDDDSSSDPAGYKRESSYKYLPFLVEHTRALNNGCELGFALEYDFFLSGEQVSDLRIIKIKNAQESGHGLRASVAYAGATSSGIAWKIEPFVRYWDIDDSEVVYIRDRYYVISIIEPANDTLELGVSARVTF